MTTGELYTIGLGFPATSTWCVGETKEFSKYECGFRLRAIVILSVGIGT
jgi:hypothetical protein